VLKQMIQMKNRISDLLMETGVSYNKQQLHKLGYFTELMSSNDKVNESIPSGTFEAEIVASNEAPGRTKRDETGFCDKENHWLPSLARLY
jgi:hypothetical protein